MLAPNGMYRIQALDVLHYQISNQSGTRIWPAEEVMDSGYAKNLTIDFLKGELLCTCFLNRDPESKFHDDLRGQPCDFEATRSFAQEL